MFLEYLAVLWGTQLSFLEDLEVKSYGLDDLKKNQKHGLLLNIFHSLAKINKYTLCYACKIKHFTI